MARVANQVSPDRWVVSILALVLAGCGSVTTAEPLTAADGSAEHDASSPAIDTKAEVPVQDGAGGAAGSSSTAGSSGAAGSSSSGAAGAPVNLLPSGIAGWHLVGGGAGPGGVKLQGDNICASVIAGAPAYLGWPDEPAKGIALAPSSPMRFAFDVTTSTPLSSFNGQVGHTSAPVTIDFAADETVTTSAKVSHTFMVPSSGDSSAGVVFSIESSSPTTVCVANVFLGSR